MNVGIGNEAAQFLGFSDFRFSNWGLLAHALSLFLLSGMQGHVTGTCWLCFLSVLLLSGVQGHVTGTCWLMLSVFITTLWRAGTCNWDLLAHALCLYYYSLACRDM